MVAMACWSILLIVSHVICVALIRIRIFASGTLAHISDWSRWFVLAGFGWIAAGSILVGRMFFLWCEEWCFERLTIGVVSTALLQRLYLDQW